MIKPITGISSKLCNYPFTNSPLYIELQAEGETKWSGVIKAQADFMCHEEDTSRVPYLMGRLNDIGLLDRCEINHKLEEYRQYVMLFLNELE